MEKKEQRRMIRSMRPSLRRRLAGRFVSWLAGRRFDRAADQAELLHGLHRSYQYFVVEDGGGKAKPGTLVIMSERAWREYTHSRQRKELGRMKRGCWYKTEGKQGVPGLTPRERELRRLMYIKTMLEAQGYLDPPGMKDEGGTE